MNTKDIRTSTDPDLAGSYAAMERAALAAPRARHQNKYGDRCVR